MKLSTKSFGFTLVELIVVITILAILGTIAFLSLASYTWLARNSVRLDKIGKLTSSLNARKISGSSLIGASRWGNEVPGANFWGTGATIGVNYIAGPLNETFLWINDDQYKDPFTDDNLPVGVVSTWDQYFQVATTLETDRWDTSKIDGTFVPRSSATIIPGTSSSGSTAFEITDFWLLNFFEVGDTISGTWIEPGTSIVAISRDGINLRLSTSLTDNATAITLASDETAWLIVSTDGNTPVVDNQTSTLAYTVTGNSSGGWTPLPPVATELSISAADSGMLIYVGGGTTEIITSLENESIVAGGIPGFTHFINANLSAGEIAALSDDDTGSVAHTTDNSGFGRQVAFIRLDMGVPILPTSLTIHPPTGGFTPIIAFAYADEVSNGWYASNDLNNWTAVAVDGMPGVIANRGDGSGPAIHTIDYSTAPESAYRYWVRALNTIFDGDEVAVSEIEMIGTVATLENVPVAATHGFYIIGDPADRPPFTQAELIVSAFNFNNPSFPPVSTDAGIYSVELGTVDASEIIALRDGDTNTFAYEVRDTVGGQGGYLELDMGSPIMPTTLTVHPPAGGFTPFIATQHDNPESNGWYASNDSISWTAVAIEGMPGVSVDRGNGSGADSHFIDYSTAPNVAYRYWIKAFDHRFDGEIVPISEIEVTP